MIGLKASRKRMEEDPDLDLVPIMNMFLVMIPFLLISASFFHLKAINTSVPVLSNDGGADYAENQVKVTLILQLEEKGFHVSAMSDNADEDTLNRLESFIPLDAQASYPMERLSLFLQDVKTRFPKSDTVIIIPEETILYETIIKTMDVARYSNDTQLFPNVVISGKVG
ncbi:MAG TPA: biopolymer transporter ExbD [Desulfomonilia bacterium]|nr:biopolymer transporter ExbD [Desulfomonilia bacterium]